MKLGKSQMNLVNRFRKPPGLPAALSCKICKGGTRRRGTIIMSRPIGNDGFRGGGILQNLLFFRFEDRAHNLEEMGGNTTYPAPYGIFT